MTDFETWWHNEGSDPKRFDEDFEEHCKRKCQIAWSNGAFMAEQSAVKILQDFQERTGLDQSGCIEAISKGDEDETSTA
jgi:hypothetical protein